MTTASGLLTHQAQGAASPPANAGVVRRPPLERSLLFGVRRDQFPLRIPPPPNRDGDRCHQGDYHQGPGKSRTPVGAAAKRLRIGASTKRSGRRATIRPSSTCYTDSTCT